MRRISSSSDLQLAWHLTAAPGGGERHGAEVLYQGEAVGELRFLRPGSDVIGDWPRRIWRNGLYDRDFYEWFYERWYVALRQPPLLVEAVDFELTLDPTLDLESRAALEAIRTLASPGSAVVGPALALLPPEARVRAKAGGLVAWASRVASQVYGGTLIVAAADDLARANA